MKTVKIIIFFLILMIAVDISYSFQANSSNYRLFPLIVSSGGEIVNSSSYKNYVATGIINGVVNSSTYKNRLGFYYTWLLADNQPCTAANQCDGGYCCSNLCKSSACPSEEAAPAAGAGAGAAAGGGGGGAVILKEEKDFSVSPSSLKTRLALGEEAEETLAIKNTGNTALTVYLAIEGIKEYLSLSDNVVSLEADESIDVKLSFIGKQVGGLAGQVIATADEIEKSIIIILEIISKLVLFDVKLDIPAEYAEVEAGDELKAQITLLNVGAPENVDVIATYFIKDLRGNIIYEEAETFAVEKQVSYAKSFKIHESTEPGNYVAIVEAVYADSFAVSSQIFEVVEKKAKVKLEILTKGIGPMIILFLILVGITLILIYKLIPKREK